MKLTTYTLNTNVNYKIALVSDLHERNADEIIKIIKECKPDVICCPGDLLERCDKGLDPRMGKDISKTTYSLHSFAHFMNNLLFKLFKNEGNPNSENVYSFFRECSKIAPILYSLGNHEFYLNEKDQSVIKENDIILLDNDSIQINGIVFGGLSPKVDEQWLDKYEKLDGYKVLLCHHPEFYNKYLKDKKIDLILSGHAHGGQIRLLNHGIFSPGQGLFPKYTKGLYFHNLMISAGCSNTVALPRWNNPCEVVLIDLKREVQ